MKSQYAVIQYVPDQVRGERINIGVLAFDVDHAEDIKVAFLKKWDRVRVFSQHDIQFVLDYVERIQIGRLTQADLGTMRQRRPYINVQLTEARGSLESVDALLAWAKDRFLVEA
jgi:hypothetical protein